MSQVHKIKPGTMASLMFPRLALRSSLLHIECGVFCVNEESDEQLVILT